MPRFFRGILFYSKYIGIKKAIVNDCFFYAFEETYFLFALNLLSGVPSAFTGPVGAVVAL
jgi:hypothetical protein